MNFLVVLPVIATVISASIPLESYGTTRGPSLTNSFPGSSDVRDNGNSDWFAGGIGALLSLPLYMKIFKLEIILEMMSCLFDNGPCNNGSGRDLEKLTAIIDSLAGVDLQNFAVRDPPQTTRLDESFAIVENAVKPNNQRNPFPIAVPALWDPYVNIRLVANQNEMPNVNHPPAGSFIPYFNRVSRHPLYVNAVTQHVKALTPAGTVLETTSH